MRAFQCAQTLSSGFHRLFELGDPGVSTYDLQFAFVDAAESFYQSVYPVLAWLGKLLELSAPHGTFRGVPLGSVSGLIDGMAKVATDVDLCHAVDHLKKVNDFRSAFLVHPRVDRPWSWMTIVYEGLPLVAYYFLPHGARVGLRTGSGHIRLHRDSSSFEPWSNGFSLPVSHSGFFVPPYLTDALTSVVLVIETAMRHVHKAIEDVVVHWKAPEMLGLRTFSGTPMQTGDAMWREDTRSWLSWIRAGAAALVVRPPSLDDGGYEPNE